MKIVPAALVLATLAAVAWTGPTSQGEVTMQHAKGRFDVELTPRDSNEGPSGGSMGRMAIRKTYHGDLEGTATGEMLTALTGVDGSAGYVAIERVEGTLAGRSGSFVLQHSGTMDRGAQSLTVTVVPDSGTGGLEDITGSLTILIEDGDHFYDLAYAFGDGG